MPIPCEDLVPDIEDFNLEETTNKESLSNVISTEKPVETNNYSEEPVENKEMSEEELELIEEEARAENFRKYQEYQKLNGGIQKISQKIEFPPKNKESEMLNTPVTCECGPDEACNICIETKGL